MKRKRENWLQYIKATARPPKSFEYDDIFEKSVSMKGQKWQVTIKDNKSINPYILNLLQDEVSSKRKRLKETFEPEILKKKTCDRVIGLLNAVWNVPEEDSIFDLNSPLELDLELSSSGNIAEVIRTLERIIGMQKQQQTGEQLFSLESPFLPIGDEIVHSIPLNEIDAHISENKVKDKQLRKSCWEALREDNEEALAEILNKSDRSMTPAELMLHLGKYPQRASFILSF